MTRIGKGTTLGVVVLLGLVLFGAEAKADEAIVTVDGGQRFSEPPPRAVASSPVRVAAGDDLIAREPELRRSPFRLTLGPAAITTGKGFGLGVGLGADIGTGSVGGRLSAFWLRGEGKNDDGSSSLTGDSVGQYAGEVTLDMHKRGPVHPVIGMGAGLLHVSRPDGRSGFAAMALGRFSVDYAVGLEDADVRIGAAITGGLVGAADKDVNDLRAYALPDVHLMIGF